MAAVRALAALAKEPVPEQVNIAYGETKLNFGRDYIIPKPFDPRLIVAVPPAVAKAAMESGVATNPITDWTKYHDDLYARMGSDNKLIRLLFNRAKLDPKRIVYTEAEHIDVLKAAQVVYEEGIGIPVLLGRKEIIRNLMEQLEFDADLEIIDPKNDKQPEKLKLYAHKFWKKKTQRNHFIRC